MLLTKLVCKVEIVMMAFAGHVFYQGNSSVMKRKSSDSLSLVLTDEEDVQAEKKMLNEKCHPVFTGLLLSLCICVMTQVGKLVYIAPNLLHYSSFSLLSNG